MRIFCDGVYDLFHHGHVNSLKEIKIKYPNSYLIVGVVPDDFAKSYKRIPIYNQIKRSTLVKSIKYIDEVLLDYPMTMTKEFMIDNNIDLIAHAFKDKSDIDKQEKYFEYPVKNNKMLILTYTQNVSTTELIDNLKNEYKLLEINNSLKISNLINCKLDINKNNKIIEFGCKDGNLSKHYINYNYIGIDLEQELLNRNINLYNTTVYNTQLSNTPFKNKYFEYSFSYQPFKNKSKLEIDNILNEIERVSKNGICIINIDLESSLYSQKNFLDRDYIIFNKDETNFSIYKLF
jgi:cytidyltransferase-like protein